MSGLLQALDVLFTQERPIPYHFAEYINIITVKLKRGFLQPQLVLFVYSIW